MSFDIFAEPVVKSPYDIHPRKGRGFSKDEVKQAKLTVKEVRRMGLIVDLRRKTSHDENVDVLKQYLKEIKQVAAAVKKEKAPSKDVSKAVTDLSTLKAVKKVEAEKLVKAGIKTISDLAYCEIVKVANKTGIDENRITAMVKAALNKV